MYLIKINFLDISVGDLQVFKVKRKKNPTMMREISCLELHSVADDSFHLGLWLVFH